MHSVTMRLEQPSPEDLVRRLATLRLSGQEPRMLTMSPETWARISMHAAAGALRFDRVDVHLLEACRGVAIEG